MFSAVVDSEPTAARRLGVVHRFIGPAEQSLRTDATRRNVQFQNLSQTAVRGKEKTEVQSQLSLQRHGFRLAPIKALARVDAVLLHQLKKNPIEYGGKGPYRAGTLSGKLSHGRE